MRIGELRLLAGLAVMLLALGMVAPRPAAGQAPSATPSAQLDPGEVLRASIGEMDRLLQAGNAGEAVRVATQAHGRLLAALGAEHPAIAVALYNLGAVQRRAGAVDEAAGNLQRAMALEARLGGVERITFLRALRELAQVEMARGQSAAALALYEGALGRLRQSRAGSAEEAQLLEEQGLLMRQAGVFAPAEAALEAALAIREAAGPPPQAGLTHTLIQLGGIARLNGRFDASERYYKRALGLIEAASGRASADYAVITDNLGVLYQGQGRFDEAEAQHRAALAIFEAALGQEHLSTGQCVANLGAVLYHQGRYEEAERLIQRALAIYARTLPAEDARIGITLDNLAGVYRSQNRLAKAAEAYERALVIMRKTLPARHPTIGTALSNLSLMRSDSGQPAAAEQLAREALSIAEATHGDSHVMVASVLNNLGLAQARLGRPAEARATFARSVAMLEKDLGGEHGLLALPLAGLGEALLAQGEVAEARATFQRSVAITLQHSGRGRRAEEAAGSSRRDALIGLVASEWLLEAQAATAQPATRQPAAKPGKSAAKASAAPSRAEAALVQTQWLQQSGVGRTMAELGARLGARTPALAALARERQDLDQEAQRLDKRLLAALALPSAARRAEDDAALRRRLEEIAARRARIDAQLAKDHPAFAELAQPRPLAPREVRGLLAANEAMLVYLPTRDHLYVWLLTRTETRWQRIEVTADVLEASVAKLRCGVDETRWYEGAEEKRCRALTGSAPRGGLLPFDVETAGELYRALVGPFARQIQGRQLLLVPAGALTSLPFAALAGPVTPGRDLGRGRWLGMSHALTVLPSVASLRSLRRDARPSAAQRPYFGIGNPLLIGPARDHAAAWGAQSCLAAQLKGRPAPIRLAVAPDPGRVLVRGGVADVEQVRLLAPLPETRDELCTVAGLLGGGQADLALGSRATERLVREMSASGALRAVRTLHFATHGLVAGDLPGLEEAALVLTPPTQASAEDDGLLTASEVAALRLDADWVILSACNTAAGREAGAAPLSGLARAFFHAGARSLLVSHWPVQSEAAVKLTTRALAEQRQTPGLGKAEALRRAMVALAEDRATPANLHPQTWAPFMVVGEGGGTVPAAAAVRPATPVPAVAAGTAQAPTAPAGAPAAGGAAGAVAPGALAPVPAAGPVNRAPPVARPKDEVRSLHDDVFRLNQ